MNEENEKTENNVADEKPAANIGRETVGQLLAARRIAEGKDIPAVAGTLRISARYLEAIEDGRNDDLPGSTYAVGFVRSYAEYLGLDEDEIVRRFKEQEEELSEKSELTFPKPIPEGGVPGGVLLLTGAILALIAYGIWYTSNDNGNDESSATIVEPVPERLSEEVTKTSSSSPQDGNSVSTDTKIIVPTETSEEKPAVESEPVADALSEEATPEAESEADSDAEVPIAETMQTTEEAAVEPEQAQSETPVVKVEQAQTPAETPPAETAPAPEQAPSVVASAPAQKPASRITVRAKSNSWIQVRDEGQDKLLFTRLLRKGNVYNVPDRDGLTLLTGNAGALEILVDGELVPPIGEAGDVRRNVTLDPQQLKSGTAVKD